MKNEKLGKVIIDGKIIDLDTAPLDELRKLQEEISNKEEEKRAEIEKFLQDTER